MKTTRNNKQLNNTKTGVFDSDSINTLSYLPKSVAITGSGIIAIEFAKIFKNLGSDVTLIIRDNIPRNALMKIGLDKDIAATLVADLVRMLYRLPVLYMSFVYHVRCVYVLRHESNRLIPSPFKLIHNITYAYQYYRPEVVSKLNVVHKLRNFMSPEEMTRHQLY